MGYSYYYEPTYATAGFAALVAVLSVFLVIVALMLLVLKVIAYWKLFQKAGQAGWKSLIPVYADYVLYGIAWKKSMFWLALGVGVASSFASGLCSSAITQIAVTGGVTVSNIAGIASGILFMLACAVIAFVIEIMFCIHLSRSFGHGGGYAVGLIFLPTVFMLILGLGNAVYQKEPCVKKMKSFASEG